MVVGLSVGRVKKSFMVVGNRVWRNGWNGLHPSRPEFFVQQTISYGTAFGGIDPFSKKKEQKVAFAENPVGRGVAPDAPGELLDGLPLPNTEELGKPLRSPGRRQVPKAFWPAGRGWSPRREHAGTYDDEWLQKHFPFLPPDFDESYFQAAPPDQQTDYLKGGEEIILAGLTPDRFTIVWRATHPLRRNIFEMTAALVGQGSRAWWRSTETGEIFLGVASQFGRGDREPWIEEDS
jgi:hypothetical protein